MLVNLKEHRSSGLLAIHKPVVQRAGELHESKRQSRNVLHATRRGVRQCHSHGTRHSTGLQEVLRHASRSVGAAFRALHRSRSSQLRQHSAYASKVSQSSFANLPLKTWRIAVCFRAVRFCTALHWTTRTATKWWKAGWVTDKQWHDVRNLRAFALRHVKHSRYRRLINSLKLLALCDFSTRQSRAFRKWFSVV